MKRWMVFALLFLITVPAQVRADGSKGRMSITMHKKNGKTLTRGNYGIRQKAAKPDSGKVFETKDGFTLMTSKPHAAPAKATAQASPASSR